MYYYKNSDRVVKWSLTEFNKYAESPDIWELIPNNSVAELTYNGSVVSTGSVETLQKKFQIGYVMLLLENFNVKKGDLTASPGDSGSNKEPLLPSDGTKLIRQKEGRTYIYKSPNKRYG